MNNFKSIMKLTADSEAYTMIYKVFSDNVHD